MKKLIPIILTAAALALSGCGLADQWAQVKSDYIDPAIEEAQTGVDPNAVDSLALGPNLTTDWSGLTEYDPGKNVGGRGSSQTGGELTVSPDYGRLLPYVGSYVVDDSGSPVGAKYGLITQEGDIVLDPVLTVLRPASYTDEAGNAVYLDIYVMGRRVTADGAETIKYAVAGADGSWVSGFEYQAVYPTELGVVCISDSQANQAVCYDETGALVFDTSKMGYKFKAGSLESMSVCGSGWMKIVYTNGQYGFLNSKGYILNHGTDNTCYFDETLGFREDIAAVKNGNVWSYIDSKGNYVAYQKYEEAGSFINGVGLAKLSGGNWAAIGKDGKVIREFENASAAEIGEGWIKVSDSVGGVTYYSTPEVSLLTMYNMPATPYSGGMWLKGVNGCRVKTAEGAEIYFSGAVDIVGHVNNQLFMWLLADDTYAVMDTDGRVVMAGQSLGFVTDAATGSVCIYDASGGSVRLYDAAGALMADHAALSGVVSGESGGSDIYGPIDGYMMCAEGSSVGWKDSSNQWIFRLKVDAGD